MPSSSSVLNVNFHHPAFLPRMFLKSPTAAVLMASLCWADRVGAQGAVAQDPGTLPAYQQAVAALRDQLPEVAVVKLRRALDSGKLKPEQRGPVLLLLAEALVRAGRAAEAVLVAQEEGVKALPEGRFWLAQGLAMTGRWREAEAVFAALAGVKNFRFATEAAFSRSGMLAALGDPEQAALVLAPLRSPAGTETAERADLWSAELQLMASRPVQAAALLDEAGAGKVSAERQYLRARIAMATGDYPKADGLFAVLTGDGTGAPSRLQQAGRLGRVRALRMAGKNEEAVPLLRQLMAAVPLPPDELLDLAFQELEALNQPPTAEMESFLNSLVAGSRPGVRIRARLALAAALESMADPKQAEAAWAAIPRDFPEHPLRAVALLRQAQFFIGQKRREEARPLMGELRSLSPSPAVAAWSAWVAGQTEYDAAAYRTASGFFKEASSKSPDLAVRAAATFNAALAELQSGDEGNPARTLALLDGSPLAEYRMAGAEFHLERALRMASLGQKEAEDGLTAFVESLPDHPRRFDALVALAEVALQSDPTRASDAIRHLDAAREAAREPWQRERVALLGCYVAEAASGPEALAAKGLQFLSDYPQSAAVTDLRMKLAQSAYRRENFSGARQLFEAIAESDPLHPLAEPALFWAGRAAVLTMETTASQQALGLWEKVFERGGPLKWQARLQEALLYQGQRQPAAALQLLEEILAPKAKPVPDAATRWQALSVRGEILAAPAFQPAEQTLGLASFDEVINTPGVPDHWRRQTLVRKGVCLETLKRPDEALEAYYDGLSDLPAPVPGPGRNALDDYWFHRAGGKALYLLETAGKYEEAIVIAKKLAKAPSPRGRAAAELVDELALKYGIWTSSP